VPWWGWALLVGGGLLGLMIAAGLWGAGLPARLRRAFERQRGDLHEEFFVAAASSGKPRGLRWKSLDWSAPAPEPALARDRGSGEIVALVPVTIQFEAIEGSDMEGLPAVGNLRNASAVFFWRQGRWQTSGKAVFNLNPDEALRHFKDQYAPFGVGSGRI
jgi:hypothetical protein